MLIQYKKDFEKTAMGLLSYLPDFKNIDNLTEEIKLNEKDNNFVLYLFRNNEGNIVGVIGTEEENNFIIVRYISLAPGFREKKYEKKVINNLQDNNPNMTISALPEYTYLLKLLKNNENK